MLLKDKVVIISGVGPGMGQSMAKLAAREAPKSEWVLESRIFGLCRRN